MYVYSSAECVLLNQCVRTSVNRALVGGGGGELNPFLHSYCNA